ncbi:MAG: alpha/beta fold hydrolase [Pseudomonadota bacterium]
MDLGAANTQPFTQWQTFQEGDICHSAFRAGRGPGVLLMHELPGMTPEFWRLANWLAARFTVFAPDLFGNDAEPTQPDIKRLFPRACISREIHLFSRDDPGPITQWLRALARRLHDETGGPGVAVIGMCMTGNFALTLALDSWVSATVASQPGLPISLPLRPMHGVVQLSDDDKRALAARYVDVMALRFKGDAYCRAARFDAIRDVIGAARLKAHTVADAHQNPARRGKNPHSVLTADLIDADDSKTKQKLTEVIAFIEARIAP